MNAVHNFPLLTAILCVSAIAQAQQPPSPVPATTETEDTARDRTSPNPAATKPISPGDPQTPADPTPDPGQATNPAEGTAADRTPPGRTPTTAGATAGQRGELVGTAVVAPNGTTIGKVVDVVFDAVSKPTFVVIASENGPAAVPYSVASSMQSEGKVVMDRAKLTSAPKVKDGEWRTKSGSQWQQDATRYWEKGG